MLALVDEIKFICLDKVWQKYLDLFSHFLSYGDEPSRD